MTSTLTLEQTFRRLIGMNFIREWRDITLVYRRDREDIDLIDVIEFIVDTVVAGVARKG